jgi:hypothetical protein
MSRLTKVADSCQNIRSFSLPCGWILQTGIFLRRLQAESFAVRNREQILALAKHRKGLRSKPRKRWRPKKKLADLPPYTKAEAYGRRLVFQTYRQALADGLIPAQAERIARMMSVLVLDRTYNGKSLRRLVALVEARGGLRAPIEAFATEKSVPHRKKTARRTHPKK